jgi:p-aminobenzoyl-glutamate transporter AbgT
MRSVFMKDFFIFSMEKVISFLNGLYPVSGLMEAALRNACRFTRKKKYEFLVIQIPVLVFRWSQSSPIFWEPVGACRTHLLFFRLRWLGFLKWRQFNGFCMGRTIAILFDL